MGVGVHGDPKWKALFQSGRCPSSMKAPMKDSVKELNSKWAQATTPFLFHCNDALFSLTIFKVEFRTKITSKFGVFQGVTGVTNWNSIANKAKPQMVKRVDRVGSRRYVFAA